MEMKIIRQDDEVTHVALIGALDQAGVAQVEAEFHACSEKRDLPVIIDMSGVTFIMSRGITMLTVCAGHLKKTDQKMILFGPQNLVENTLRNVAMDRIVPIVHSQADAEELLRI